MKTALYQMVLHRPLEPALAFGHIMYHDTVHMLTRHEEGHLFVAVHTILAVALGVLSLLGAYFLLTGGRGQNSS